MNFFQVTLVFDWRFVKKRLWYFATDSIRIEGKILKLSFVMFGKTFYKKVIAISCIIPRMEVYEDLKNMVHVWVDLYFITEIIRFNCFQSKLCNS